MGSVISVCNLKGGAGKSTIAVNLACAIHDLTEERCTLVDADRQGTSDAWASQGKLPVRVLKKVLQEAKPEERYPGMLWVVQVKELAAKSGIVGMTFTAARDLGGLGIRVLAIAPSRTTARNEITNSRQLGRRNRTGTPGPIPIPASPPNR